MIQQLAGAWYAWLSGVMQAPVMALQQWADHVEVAAFTVVILGLIGATSPCQLSTNMGALAYACTRPSRGRALALAAAYVAGKIVVYSAIGGAAVLVGNQLQATAIPVVIMARKALGPLMLVVALGLLGVFRPRLLAGHRLALRLRDRWPAEGLPGAFLLGVAFSFAFCPTLFWLFFGLAMPLALKTFAGWTFPALFVIGSSLPLLAVTAFVALGASAAESAATRVGRFERPARLVAAGVLILAGLHDTVVYWAL